MEHKVEFVGKFGQMKKAVPVFKILAYVRHFNGIKKD